MRKLLITFVLLASQFANVSVSSATSGEAQRNLGATKRIYSQFLSSPTPNVAGLTLFINLMPKGGDVHHHFSGSIYAETYLDWAKENGFCIYNKTDPQLGIVQYRVETKPAELTGAKLDACLSIDAVLKNDLFYRNLLMEWSSKDYANHYHQQTPPDKHFFDTFRYFENISPYGYRSGLELLKRRAKEENVSYIETMLKSGPSINAPELASAFKSINSNSSVAETQSAMIQAYTFLKNNAEVKEKIESYIKLVETASEGLDDDSFRLRFLAYSSRNSSPEVVFSRLYSSFSAASQSNKIVGVNFVGPENHQIAMRDYSLHMQMLDFLGKQFPQSKLSLHAGELVLGMVPPEGLRFHINEAVTIAHANRIGHGIDIAHEKNAPALLSYMAKNRIPVEINLTSNKDILGVSEGYHPLLLYKKYNVPFVISTDDPGVSRNNLSGEYLIYVKTFRPSYEDLKKTVYSSIQYSFLSEAEKKNEVKKLDQKFLEFESRMAEIPSK